MKTTTCIIAILAIGGQAILNGQTVPTIVSEHNNYFIYGTWKKTSNQPTKKTETVKTNNVSNQPLQVANINAKIDVYNKQYVELQKSKLEINNTINSFFLNQDINDGNAKKQKSELIPLQQQLAILLTDVEALKLKSQQVKEIAKTNGSLQTAYSNALQYDNACILKQIEASEIVLKLFYEKFNFNKITIYSLVRNFNDKGDVLLLINNYLTDSNKYLQLAKEMREEAYAHPNKAATLGGLSNAEEKEILALNKQEKAIELLNDNQVYNFTISGNNQLLCFK